MDLKKYVKNVENFPIPNKTFHDITPLMQSGEAFSYAIGQIIEFSKTLNPDIIVGPEARGFIIGCPLAYALNIGFIPVRKPGKLPRETISVDYKLEYGSDTLCMHKDAISKEQRVLIVDDVLATGGTMKATIDLVNKLKGKVIGSAFLMELQDLNGREVIENYTNNAPIKTLLNLK